jgi:hypothetical protein
MIPCKRCLVRSACINRLRYNNNKLYDIYHDCRAIQKYIDKMFHNFFHNSPQYHIYKTYNPTFNSEFWRVIYSIKEYRELEGFILGKES